MQRFGMTMELDERGVVITVCEGVFDASQWVRQRRAIFESRYPLEAYDGHPVVSDMRRCQLPALDWASQFKAIADAMKHQRMKPFRRALIIGRKDGADLAVALFAQYQKIFHHPDVETRAFLDYDEGYAWALASLDRPSECAKLP
ncbi:hypothetical protein SAMN06265365_113135 [Tistlia consotensis]|uniref:SpoIIAA-like n=1 Tax=Tistlia consotensis USBA 355 TaxID=560819 RepID=A0A1Y6C1A8_9PROT|nr:hypothetical protein [Tistlia consotensis]SMF40324.1 hypothetical protein SAMN05428998_11410 [Tistlia consotensis USBA 355]SNR75083.1 hypothetical protein SAMN06265365_113135 [Tistlia consotensis]